MLQRPINFVKAVPVKSNKRSPLRDKMRNRSETKHERSLTAGEVII